MAPIADTTMPKSSARRNQPSASFHEAFREAASKDSPPTNLRAVPTNAIEATLKTIFDLWACQRFKLTTAMMLTIMAMGTRKMPTSMNMITEHRNSFLDNSWISHHSHPTLYREYSQLCMREMLYVDMIKESREKTGRGRSESQRNWSTKRTAGKSTVITAVGSAAYPTRATTRGDRNWLRSFTR